jgi:hypothetical protein
MVFLDSVIGFYDGEPIAVIANGTDALLLANAGSTGQALGVRPPV